MKIVKLNKLAGLVAALLLVCLAAPLFAADYAALIKAAESGNTSAVKALIDAGADVNARNNRGETALMRQDIDPLHTATNTCSRLELISSASASRLLASGLQG